ncbi:MAG: nicotinate (nicotinamide) nucleotide adenylyltransferase [Pseudomonadota bacterium]
MTTPRRIGLFGGTFDPPHLAHLALARLALDVLALDELRWLPAGQPWQKAGRELADGAHRVSMVRLLAAGEPRFVVDQRELQRQGPSYTVDTVREVAQEVPGCLLFLVIGQDQYARFDTWREWPVLLERLTLAVAAREGVAPAAPPALAGVPHRLCTLPLPAMPVSSSAVRAALRRGEPVDDLTGGAVARYIARHHLYRRDAAAH